MTSEHVTTGRSQGVQTIGRTVLPVRGTPRTSADAIGAVRVPRAAVLGLGVASVLVCAALVWFRLTPTARDTLWAEDGRLFLAGAERHGLAVTFAPYAGYLQVVPRLIADGVVWLSPVSAWADAMTAASCLVAGGTAVAVFFCSRAVVPSPALRAVLAAITVLLPLGPRDVLGNAANLHSVLLWGLFWLVLARPATRRGALALGGLGMLAALSEIQAAFLLPLMAVVVWRRRQSAWLLAGPLVGIAAQLAATIASPRAPGRHVSLSALSVAEGYVINGVMPDLAPYSDIGPLLAAGGLLLGVLVLGAILALAVVAFRRTDADRRIALVAAFVLSVLVYAASVLVNPGTYYAYATLNRTQLLTVWLTRYGVVPGMLLLAMAVVSASILTESAPESSPESSPEPSPRSSAGSPGAPRVARQERRRLVGGVAVVGIVAILVAGYHPSWTRRSDGPTWSTQLPAATEACRSDPSLRLVELRETIDWMVPVQCSRLDR